MYLLDTCAFISALKGDPKLPERVREVMDNDTIYISLASFWEIAVKQTISKLDIVSETMFELHEICKTANIITLPIGIAHMERMKILPLIHRDIFDRIIIATAATEHLTVITSDAIIWKYEEINCLWKKAKED